MSGRLRFSHLLLMVPLVAVIVWVGVRTQRVLEGPQAVLEALQSGSGPILPSGADSGFSRSSVTVYDRETLYECVGDDATHYLELGFQTGRGVTYSSESRGEVMVEAIAFRFGMSSGAREAWETKRPEGATTVDGLEQAVANDHVMAVVRGRDLLRLRVVSGDGRARAALEKLVRSWLEQREREADE